jgi:hypothetical protein
MDKVELIVKLQALGVHPSSYSLGVMKNSDCMCVVEAEGLWKVYYVERDDPKELASFSDEASAYDFVYRQFQKWLG